MLEDKRATTNELKDKRTTTNEGEEKSEQERRFGSRRKKGTNEWVGPLYIGNTKG